VVVHTDLPRADTFECSDPWLNKLYENTRWGQKGNFLEIPTDCPQRDERLGWTGDAQIFAPTALYNMDAGNFYRQWLFAVRDSVRDGPGGGFADTAPNTGHGHGSAGWAEAGIIIPWVSWLHTGDRRILVESMPSIQHCIEMMASQSPDGIRKSPPAWGDWLAPGFDLFKAPPSYELIATAYFAHAADLAARIAETIDRPELAARNRALREKVRAAFQREYIASDGRIAGDVQNAPVRAHPGQHPGRRRSSCDRSGRHQARGRGACLPSDGVRTSGHRRPHARHAPQRVLCIRVQGASGMRRHGPRMAAAAPPHPEVLCIRR